MIKSSSARARKEHNPRPKKATVEIEAPNPWLLTPLVPYNPPPEEDHVLPTIRDAIDKLRKNLDADCYTISGLFQRDEIDFDQWEQWLRQKLEDYCKEYNTKFAEITGESIDTEAVLKTCYNY